MDAKTDIPVNGDFGPRKQKRKKQKMVAELLLDYAKNSTLHGLRYITEPGVSVIEKIFWGITFVISVVLCFLLIKQLYHKWIDTPVIVSLDENIISVGEVSFPSVTICPQQKIMVSKFNYTSELEKLKYEKNNTIDETTLKLENIRLICRYGNFKQSDRNCSNASTIDNIVEVSPKIDDLFKICKWRGKYYKCRDIFTKVLTTEGVCFNFNSLAANETFNYNGIQHDYNYTDAFNKSKKWNVEQNYLDTDNDAYPWRGRTNGAQPDLQVTVRTSTNELDTLCNGANIGFKIYLQHPTDFPQASLSYYAVSPGHVTSLALKFNMITTSNSLKDYMPNVRKCYFPGDRPLQYFQIYTLKNCQLECQSNFTFEKCGCVWFNMPRNDSKSICTARRYMCVAKALDELAELELKAEKNFTIPACRCFPACNYIDYSAEMIKTDYDYEAVLKSYYNFYKRTNKTREQLGLSYRMFQLRLKYLMDDSPTYSLSVLRAALDCLLKRGTEFSKIDLYFKEPRFVSMRRSELYGRNEFLANCGGLLGLFLGFSFLSLVEIIYFTTIRFCCLLKQDLKAEKKNDDNRID